MSKNVLIRSKYIMTSLNVLLIPPFDGSRDGVLEFVNGLTECVDGSIEMV